MNICELPEIIKKLNEKEVLANIFNCSLLSLMRNGYEIMSLKLPYPFVTEAFYEYFMRYNENGSEHLTAKVLGEINETIFKTPNIVYKKVGLNNFMSLYYLWQMEDHTDLFLRLYRYSFIFNYQFNEINIKEDFFNKFGCEYNSYLYFCLLFITTCISLRESEISQKQYFANLAIKIFKVFKRVTVSLSLTKEQYKNKSIQVCKNQNLLSIALKTSKSFPLIEDNETIACYIPHTVIPACTSSLLFRLTDGNDKLHGKIAKNVLEDYCYRLFKTQKYYKIISKEIKFSNDKLSSDLLVAENKNLYCLEIKSFTPNTQTRLMDQKNINKQIVELAEGMYQLYKFIYKNFPSKVNLIKNFSLNNRYGVLIPREDASFDRKNLYGKLFVIIENEENRILSENEKNNIIEHIKISGLDEIEDMIYTNTPLSRVVDFYNQNDQQMFYTASRSFNKTKENKEINEFIENIEKTSEKLTLLLTDPKFIWY